MASATRLLLDGSPHTLFAWGATARFGWLSPAPSSATPRAWQEHSQLLAHFGGIVEMFNEPEETWLANTTVSLTADEAGKDASFVLDMAWAFEQQGRSIPIVVGDHYPLSWEANGNCVICNRKSGSVLLFAHDHAFDHVVALEGCPDYTLYSVTGAPDFRSWVETVAAQWLRAAA